MKTSKSPKNPKQSPVASRLLLNQARQQSAIQAAKAKLRNETHAEILRIALGYLSPVQVDDAARRVAALSGKPVRPSKAEVAAAKLFAAALGRHRQAAAA